MAKTMTTNSLSISGFLTLFFLLSLQLQAATYTFSGTGDWNDPTRWIPGVPDDTLAQGDSIIIHVSAICTVSNLKQTILSGAVMEIAAGTSVTVQGSQGFLVFGSFICNGTLDLAGELEMAAGSTGGGTGSLHLNNGFAVLRNTNGELPGAVFTWTIGTFVIGSGATYTAAGDFTKPIFAHMTLEPGSAFIALQDFTSEFGGLLFSQGEITVHGFFSHQGGINNHGVFTLLSDGLLGPFTFTGEGVLNIHGTVTSHRFPGCRVALFGTFLLPNFNGFLNFNLFTLHPGSSFSLDGFSNTTVSKNQSLNIPAGATFIIPVFSVINLEGSISNQGSFILDGTLQVNGTFNNGGTLHLNPSSEIAVHDGGHFNTSVPLVMDATLTLQSGSNFNAAEGFENAGTANLETTHFSVSGLFKNSGTLNLNGGSDFANTSNFSNSGVVNLNGGTLQITQDEDVFFNWVAGALIIKTGATLTAAESFTKPIFAGMTLEPGSAFIALQDFTSEFGGLLFSQGEITVHGFFSHQGGINNHGVFTLLSDGLLGPFTFTGEGVLNIHGTVTSHRFPGCRVALFGTFLLPNFNGFLNFNLFTLHPGSSFSLDGFSNTTVSKNQSLTIPAGATFIIPVFSVINLEGSIFNQGTFLLDGTFDVNSAGSFNSNGTLHLGSGGLLSLQSNQANELAGMLNWETDATMNVGSSGACNLSAPLTIPSGSLIQNDGTLNVHSNLTISSNGACNNTGMMFLNTGNLQVFGTLTNEAGAMLTNDARITNLGNFTNEGQYLGSGSFHGFFQNGTGGIFSPGNSPGCHSFGNSMANAGTIIMEIGGPSPCVGHDFFGVIESANLGGTLQIELINGFEPVPGQTFTLLSAAFINGTFSSVQFPAGITGAVQYLSDEVKVKFNDVLPVELTRFQAFIEEEKVKLLWETATEQNNEGFFVERLIKENNSWTVLGFVAGNGTTTVPQQYYLLDETPSTGVNYYRLRQRDYDGQEEYSEVLAVDLRGHEDLPDLGLRAFPNPVRGGALTIVLPENTAGDLQVQIIDTAGRQVRVMKLGAGIQVLDVSDLNPGVYWLRAGILSAKVVVLQ